MKKTIVTAIFTFFCSVLISQENISVTDLLKGYLENDRSLKQALIDAEKAGLSEKSAKITNGFDISLSTGTMRFQMNGEDGKFSMTPLLKASLPQAQNLNFSASTQINTANKNTVSDTSLALGADIISTNSKKHKISVLKSERATLEAERNIQAKALSAEKSFYTTLQSLLKQAQSIVSAQNELYSNKIDFEQVKAKGYSPASSTYRLAEMKVKNSEHSIESSIRSFQHDFAVFYKKCGVSDPSDFDSTLQKNDFTALIPRDIPETEPLNFSDFKKGNFREIESAEWTNKINSLSREADKNFSLGASAGYTFQNSSANSDTVDAGLSMSLGGLNIDAGLSFPINASQNPVFSASASVSPNVFRQNNLSKEKNLLDEKSEILDIETAEYNYRICAVDMEKELQDIIWQKQTAAENLEMYIQLEKDMKRYFEGGIITESEYLSAKTNRQRHEIEKFVNQIDLIVYNNQVKSMFTEDAN